MKLLKNKFVIGTICIIAGLLLTFIALPALQGSNQGAYTNVIRLKKTVQSGTQISAEMVETVKIPETIVKKSIGDISSVVGKYANTELYDGDYLTIDKLSNTLEENNLLAAGMAKGKTVVSITLPSLASGVSGRLQPGDIVTVMTLPKNTVNQPLGAEPETTTENADSKAVIYPELHYLEVCMATTGDGSDADVSRPSDRG